MIMINKLKAMFLNPIVFFLNMLFVFTHVCINILMGICSSERGLAFTYRSIVMGNALEADLNASQKEVRCR